MKRFIAVFCIFFGTALLSAENTDISFSAGAAYADYFFRTLDGVELNNAAVKKPLANSLTIKGGVIIRL